MKQSEDYYVLSQIGPWIVNNQIEMGYKIVGRYKLYNPDHRRFNFDEFEQIKELLSIWLNETYPEESFDDDFFRNYPTLKLADALNYDFTMVKRSGYIEIDFYKLKLSRPGKVLIVFIGKGSYLDMDREKAVEELVYPFYTEAWEQTISERRLFSPGDLW